MRRWNRKYYVVSFIHNDEGRKRRMLLRIPNGCKFLSRVRFPDGKKPTYFKGHRVIRWVNVYSADDAIADEFAPIIKRRKDGVFDRLLRTIFGEL